MRPLKRYRLFGGELFTRYGVLFDTREDAEFDAGVRRSIGYKARITTAHEKSTGTWWVLWLRKKR